MRTAKKLFDFIIFSINPNGMIKKNNNVTSKRENEWIKKNV